MKFYPGDAGGFGPRTNPLAAVVATRVVCPCAACAFGRDAVLRELGADVARVCPEQGGWCVTDATGASLCHCYRAAAGGEHLGHATSTEAAACPVALRALDARRTIDDAAIEQGRCRYDRYVEGEVRAGRLSPREVRLAGAFEDLPTTVQVGWIRLAQRGG